MTEGEGGVRAQLRDIRDIGDILGVGQQAVEQDRHLRPGQIALGVQARAGAVEDAKRDQHSHGGPGVAGDLGAVRDLV